MKLEKPIAKKIIADALLSLLLYALPVILMFVSFYISGKKPWQHKPANTEQARTTVKTLQPKTN